MLSRAAARVANFRIAHDSPRIVGKRGIALLVRIVPARSSRCNLAYSDLPAQFAAVLTWAGIRDKVAPFGRSLPRLRPYLFDLNAFGPSHSHKFKMGTQSIVESTLS